MLYTTELMAIAPKLLIFMRRYKDTDFPRKLYRGNLSSYLLMNINDLGAMGVSDLTYCSASEVRHPSEVRHLHFMTI